MNDAITWTLKIQRASSDADVVRIVHEYLATWTPSEISTVAAGTWPGELPDKVGICEAAVDVVRAEMSFSGDAGSHLRLREFAAVLIASANRFGQLESPFRGTI